MILAQEGPRDVPPESFKIAFIGDSGNPSLEFNKTREVLEFIRAEEADMVLHQGDMGYGNAAGWIDAVNEILGVDFPYFFSPGNHDGAEWAEFYGPFLTRRIERLGAVHGIPICTGDFGEGYPQGVGLRADCNFQGIHFVLSDVGFWPGGSGNPQLERLRMEALDFIDATFTTDDSIWRICSWHASSSFLTIAPSVKYGVGLAPYDLCKDHGVMIATAHSHSYSRTRTLINMNNGIVNPRWPADSEVHLGRGSTFAVVSGLGGAGIGRQSRCFDPDADDSCDIWARTYTEAHGALFVEFHVDGDPRKAHGYFRDINGETVDEFFITNENGLPRGTLFVRGDANTDDAVDIADGIAILSFLFGGGRIGCRDAADVDDNGQNEITDAIYVFNNLFLGGPAPRVPYPRPGIDYTDDDLVDC